MLSDASSPVQLLHSSLSDCQSSLGKRLRVSEAAFGIVHLFSIHYVTSFVKGCLINRFGSGWKPAFT
jgi:hypothetical protein